MTRNEVDCGEGLLGGEGRECRLEWTCIGDLIFYGIGKEI
jgi:hypothetical protein